MPSPEDGTRVLVDRLWPRGVRKADAAIDCWLKEIAPSSELRRWFGHDPSRWDEVPVPLSTRIIGPPGSAGRASRAGGARHAYPRLFGAREDHNQAVALRGMLLR